MRPTPEELIDGLVYSLENELRPQLASAWANRVADAMHWTLLHLKARWNGEPGIILAERKELEFILDKAQTIAAFSAIGGLPVASTADSCTYESRLIEHNHRLRALLDEVIEAFPHDDPAARPLWSDILAYLQNQIAREETLLYPDAGGAEK